MQSSSQKKTARYSPFVWRIVQEDFIISIFAHLSVHDQNVVFGNVLKGKIARFKKVMSVSSLFNGTIVVQELSSTVTKLSIGFSVRFCDFTAQEPRSILPFPMEVLAEFFFQANADF